MGQLLSKMRRSVFGKVLGLTVLLVGLSTLGSLATIQMLANRSYHQARQQIVDGSTARVQQEVAAQRLLAEQLAVLVANEPPVQAAFAARDRAELTALVQPAFNRLKADYGMAQFQFHTPPATSFLRLHSPKKFGDDLSSFRRTVVEANQKQTLVSGVEGGVAGLGVRAVAPVVYQGRHVGTVEFGTSLGDAFVASLADQLEAGAALYLPATDPGAAPEAAASSLDEQGVVDAGVLGLALAGTASHLDVSLKAGPRLVSYYPLTDTYGATVAAIVVSRDATALVAARDHARQIGLWYGAGVLAVGLLVGTGLSFAASRSITGPVRRMGTILDAAARGDFTLRAPTDGDLTVARMAESLNTALDTTATAIRGVLQTSEGLASGVADVQSAGDAMATAAGAAFSQAEDVAHAAAEVSHNVEAAAAGSAQMNSSIQEIASTAAEAARAGTRAVQRAGETNEQVGRLGESSAGIGEVIQLISSIAEQTNLLSLNATIEAARAGEMGKGFAVVAGEVKDLAHQTAVATEDIAGRVEAIQSEASTAVQAIEAIGAVIGQVNEFQTTIASAVEEQTATTSEITQSVGRAASAVHDIADTVDGLVQATHTTSEAARRSVAAAAAVADQGERLRTLVGGFRV